MNLTPITTTPHTGQAQFSVARKPSIAGMTVLEKNLTSEIQIKSCVLFLENSSQHGMGPPPCTSKKNSIR